MCRPTSNTPTQHRPPRAARRRLSRPECLLTTRNRRRRRRRRRRLRVNGTTTNAFSAVPRRSLRRPRPFSSASAPLGSVRAERLKVLEIDYEKKPPRVGSQTRWMRLPRGRLSLPPLTVEARLRDVNRPVVPPPGARRARFVRRRPRRWRRHAFLCGWDTSAGKRTQRTRRRRPFFFPVTLGRLRSVFTHRGVISCIR